MLVTKREVKQTSKKLLSVLLAVIMIMTSMSVCFGTVAFAAGKDVDVTTLANALKFDSVKNATFSGSANNYTVSDPDGKVLAAIEAYFSVVDAMANKKPTVQTPSSGSSNIAQTGESSDKTYRTINHLNARVKTLLQSKMGGDYTTYNVDKFITGLLAGSTVSEGTTMVDGSASTSNNTTVPKTPLSAAPDVKLTVMMESAVTGYTLDTLPDSVVTSKIFTVKHANTNYDYKYTFTDGGRCDDDKYEHDYWFYYNYSSYSESNGASKSTQTIKNTQSTLETYADYFTMSLEDLVDTAATTLNTVKTAVTNARANVVTDFGAGVYTHFFSEYDVVALSANIELAKEIQVLEPKLMAAWEEKEEGYADIISDKQALIALSQTVKAGIDAYNAASAGAKDFADKAGFIIADVNTFYAEVLREIELIELRELITDIKADMLTYAAYNTDGIDEGTVTSADIGAAINKIASYQSQLTKYQTADINEIAEDDNFAGTLVDVKNALSVLSAVAGYNDRFSAEYAKFASEIFSVTDVNGDIGTLLDALSGYDSWYTGLKALINEMKSTLGEETAEKLFDDLNDVMIERMDDAYVALNALLEAQIDYAYDLFKAFIADGETITMANVSQYNKMKASIGLINVDAYNFLKGTSNFDISDEAVAKYNEMQRDFPTYQEFLNSHGFSTYKQTEIADLERPDTEKDIARENENGVYKTSDEDIEKIIELLDALLQNDTVKELLGSLINKDKETGEPTGEAFDLADLLNGLIEGIYSDSLINTIVQYVYPLVCKEFAKVWAGLPASIQIQDIPVEVMGSKKDVDVDADLNLYDVETAIAAVGVYLAPTTLAKNLQNSYGKNSGEYKKYTDVISVLSSATTKAVYNLNGNGDADDTFQNPWEDPKLFENVYDEVTGEQIFNDDGTPKQVYKLNWGIDEAEDKRAAFIDAACAALSGLEPLLFGLLTNKTQANAKDSDGVPRGHKIGTGSGKADVKIVINLSLDLTIDPITLVLSFGGNDGYDNALAPIFEALGLENIPHGETLTTTRKILEDGLFAMIDQLIEKVAEAPVTFILEALPNLCYALEGGLVEPLLHMLKTEINYYADAAYSCNAYITTVTGTMPQAMKSEEPILINLGEMINLKDMGLDIGSFQAIWDMIAGSVELLADMDAPDAGKIATMGKLVEKTTNRSQKSYTGGTNGKAYHIEANKADVLVYLLKYVLGSGLIDGLVENPEGIVADLLASLNENPDIILAAVVELLNQKEYDTLREFDWFDGLINNESVVGNSAYEDYLNPNNDWTKDKAQYLYEHIDSIVSAVLTMAGVDFDLHTLLEEKVGGLFTNETVTALAKLLGNLGDINSLISGDKTETAAPAIDAAALITEFLGIDLSAYADYANIGENEVIDFGVTNAATFVEAVVELLAPLQPVVDFLLAGEDLVINIEGKEVKLVGYNGYENAIVPILEALDAPEVEKLGEDENVLDLVLREIVAEIAILAESLTPIKTIVDILPGALYFIASKGLSVSVRNLLQPVYVILDTIRPVYDLDLNALINGLLPEDFGVMLNIDDIGLDFIFDLLAKLVPELDLSDFKDLFYDICFDTATEYDSISDLQDEWKRGSYSDEFDQADLLTVVLSFVLEWATKEENAKALDELIGTDILENIGVVFTDMNIEYDTPVWYYWFDTEAKFEDYISGGADLPNTLLMLDYPNDWSEESAQYIADNISDLVDMVLGLVNKDKEDAAKTVSELLKELVNGYLNADTVNELIGLITGLLEGIDENLIEAAGLLLGVDIIGLKDYVCEAEINSVHDFAAELAAVLTKYAAGLVNLLFFGKDYRFLSKHDAENKVVDEIVINGGLGYEKGLALILEVLDVDAPSPEDATAETVLLALADRIEAILASPVNEVLDILPNLIYFLNANGGTVAVNNILAPVYALLEKLTVLGVELDLASLLGFDLKHLRLDEIIDLIESKTGLDLTEAEKILVDLCFGKIEKAEYIYKMVAGREDVVTVLLTTALLLTKNEANVNAINELLGTEVISAVKKVFESTPVTYRAVEWYALDENDIDYDNATVGVIKSAIEYPNNWTEEAAQYVAALLESDELDKLIAGLIDENYASLGDLLSDKVNIYTPELLEAIQKALGDLIGGLDENLKDLVNVGLGAADALLGADVQGLLDYDVSGVNDKASFVAALTGMLMEVEGLVDWLLLGQDYELFVDDKNENGIYDKGEQIITLNGGHGYAEGLALVLEALGVENLPDVYAMEEIDTEAVVSAVLTATFDRVDAIFAAPVAEVFELLPNVLYFINSNGLTVAVENLIGAVNVLLLKLEGLGVELDIASLINFSDILGVETELALDNITMEAVIDLVAELTGLNLDKVADVLVGFALGRVEAYESVSNEIAFKMYYHDDFAKYDMITVLATVAIITLTDDANADKVKELLGEDIYQLILNLINMGDVPVQEFSWLYTDKADTGEVFSVIGEAGVFEDFTYGEIFTEEMAQYIADNFGEFVTNVIVLLGLDVNGDGETEEDLSGVINGLLGGSLYNSANVIAIRDALAGVLANLTKLEVKGAVVGDIIAEVLKKAEIADIAAVADVEVPEFTDDRAQFVASLCDVLEPVYGVLKYVLADEDFTFFVNADKTDAITLKGAEGYAYGIIPLLEALKCEGVLTTAEYYAAVEADGDALLTSIINPLLDRVDAILAGDTAQEILDMLTNLIYFVNSNGVDTVVKNTLNAVYALLAAIEPIAKIDLYELIGIDLAEIDFDWLVDKLFEILAKAGYEFTWEDIDYVNALTVGTLQSFTSANGLTAYEMVYAEGEEGDKKELVTVVLNLIVTFLTHEQNREVVLDFLRDNLGMCEEARPYVQALLDLIADCIKDTQLGTEAALAAIYYVFYGVDTGVQGVVDGKNNLDNLWQEALAELRKENNAAGDLIEEILGWEIFEDLIDANEIAPNGLIAFFQKIIEIFKSIIEFFSNLFNKTEAAAA